MFEAHFKDLLILIQNNPGMALAVSGVVAALFYFKPKEMFKLLVFLLFIIVIFYFITLFAETLNTGSKQKDQMIYKSKGILDE
jgi:cell division protein FtsW (lipid II flippase)